MNPSPTHITATDSLADLITTIAKGPCSAPVLFDIPTLGPAEEAALQAIWLSGEERQRMSRLAFPKRRKEWLAGRICAKMAIEDYFRSLGRESDIPDRTELTIASSDVGRPFVLCRGTHPFPPEPEISISHSGGFALALAAGSPCGVDIQKTGEGLVRVKERFCTAREEDLLGPVMNDPLLHLALLWAAKEAAQKALSLAGMPGLLDLVLEGIEKIGREELLLLFSRSHLRASQIRVLAGTIEGYGLGICIP